MADCACAALVCRAVFLGFLFWPGARSDAGRRWRAAFAVAAGRVVARRARKAVGLGPLVGGGGEGGRWRGAGRLYRLGATPTGFVGSFSGAGGRKKTTVNTTRTIKCVCRVRSGSVPTMSISPSVNAMVNRSGNMCIINHVNYNN